MRQALGIRALRFAIPDELRELTGLTPGAVPHFGNFFDWPTHCDARLAENERINFNAGDHSISVSLACTHWALATRHYAASEPPPPSAFFLDEPQKVFRFEDGHPERFSQGEQIVIVGHHLACAAGQGRG